jgi:hypothetical protein
MELPGFAKRFDPISAGGVGEAAVMKGDTMLQETRKVAAEEVLIFRCHAQRPVHRQSSGDLSGHFFRIPSTRGKKQKRCESRMECGNSHPWPEAMH